MKAIMKGSKLFDQDELTELSNKSECLGLMKARAICRQKIVELGELMTDPLYTIDDRAKIQMNINTVNSIIIQIDGVMNQIHNK